MAKSKRVSRYTTETPIRTIPVAYNVGEVIEQLRKLPKDLPVTAGLGDGVKLKWFNVGDDDEGLDFDEVDEEDEG